MDLSISNKYSIFHLDNVRVAIELLTRKSEHCLKCVRQNNVPLKYLCQRGSERVVLALWST